MTELDLGWEDVLRRAQRRPRRRLVLAAVLAAGFAGGGSALGVALTQNASALRLPMDQVGGTTVTYVIDPHTRGTVIAVARWKRHDGVCFLVPKVRAGCLRGGRALPLVPPPPLLLRGRKRHGTWLLVVRNRATTVEVVDGKGRVVVRVRVGR
jgi:hypothetical protein